MKKKLSRAIVATITLVVSYLCSAQDPAGTMEEADTILPTAYRVKMHLGREVSKRQISKQTFSIREKDTNEKVTIVSVRRFGAINPATPDMIKGVMLDAALNPAQTYLVDISFPDGQLKTVEIAPLESAPPDQTPAPEPLVNLNKRFLQLEVVPFVAEGSDSLGLKYDIRYNLKNAYVGSGLLRLELQSHGEFSLTRNDDEKIQNSLNGGLTASYLYNVHAAIPLGNETRTYAYPMGFKVSPAEFEMNKQFSLVNYTTKALVGGAVPYADYPALLWSKWFNLDVPFTPPTLFSGFAFLKNVKDDGSDNLSRLGHARWDTEFLYDLPLHNQLDLRFAWRAYVGLEESFCKNIYEVSIIYYTDTKRSQGFVAAYSEGAAPPEFIHTSSWRIGYMAKF